MGSAPCSIRQITLAVTQEAPQLLRGSVAWLIAEPARQSIDHSDRGVLAQGKPVNLQALYDALRALRDVLYIGPFRNAINTGGEAYYDLSIGTQFISVWNAWKNGPEKLKNRRIQVATADVGAILEFKSFDVNASSDGKTFQIYVDGKPYRLDELGSGVAQFLVVFGAAAIRRPSFIAIDEPELNLHPALQRDFLLSLARYAEHGVLCATHCIGLARATADFLYSITPGNRGPELRNFNANIRFAEFAGELGFSAYSALGYDRILLVEGVTEVKTVQQFLRTYGKDHQVVLIPLGGSGMINAHTAQELGELTRLSPNVSVLIDSEKSSPSDSLAAERQQFVTNCGALGIAAHVTNRRATENYFPSHAVAAVHPSANALSEFEALDPALHWRKSSNWRIAAHVTRADLDATDLGPFLIAL